ncbi:MAG: MerR family transcriptional regulator [Actinomycetota bacterium]
MPEQYYTIGEVLALLLEEFPDITISKIRFLESQGLITPERTTAGYRKFTKPEVERLRFILREQKDNFLPLRVIRDRLEGETSDGLLRPDDITDPSMPRGIRAPSVGHPTNRATAERASVVPAANSAKKKRPERLSKLDILESTGVDSSMLTALERMKFVRPQLMGTEPFYDETDRDIVHLAGRLAALGVEPRLLMAWRLAAEREADVFEPIVKAAQNSGGGDRRDDAMKLLDDLVGLGEELRTALLRNVTKGLRSGS